MILIYVGIALIVLAVVLFIYNLISPVKYEPSGSTPLSVPDEIIFDTQDKKYGPNGTVLLEEEDKTRLLQEDKTRLLKDDDRTRLL